jgi:hypothetical protein
MARTKKARGRFSIVLGLDTLNWRCDSLPTKDIGAREMVTSLREYADFIEKYFVKLEQHPPVDARLTDSESGMAIGSASNTSSGSRW